MKEAKRRYSTVLTAAVFSFALLLPGKGVACKGRPGPGEPTAADRQALWLGHRVAAIAAAIRNPEQPDAMNAILELGRDARYYVMVRGWLAMQLHGDRSILAAQDGNENPRIAARAAFLEAAIRAIDLE